MHLEPEVRGIEFESYFMQEVAPVLELGGCTVEDMRGTTMDLIHGVDVVIHHPTVGSIKIDLCYDAQTKLWDREDVSRDKPGRFQTEGLISNRVVECFRKEEMTLEIMLETAERIWNYV